MNKYVKMIVVGSFILVAVIAIVAGVVFYNLPSATSFTKLIKGSATSSPLAEVVKTAPVSQSESELTQLQTIESVPDKEIVENKIDLENKEKVYQDLTAQDTPLSNFCGSLKNAKIGVFSEASFNDAVVSSVQSETQDPRIQAAKPLFRYILRLPKMNQFISEVEAASEKEEQGFTEKAQFYASAYSAFSEMKEHQADIESVLDRGYIFIGLNNLVAKKPELVNDPKIQSFCNNTETLFNQSSPVDFDREKKDFLNLLSESGVQPKDIAFDPNYKTKINLNLDGKALTLEGGWLEDIIDEDQASTIQ